MTVHEEFRIRTEDLQDDEILALYVPARSDAEIVSQLKGVTPVILEGSRGTGKSFLLKVAASELAASFQRHGLYLSMCRLGNHHYFILQIRISSTTG